MRGVSENYLVRSTVDECSNLSATAGEKYKCLVGNVMMVKIVIVKIYHHQKYCLYLMFAQLSTASENSVKMKYK